MFVYLYEWLRNISYYLILVTAVTYVLPSGSYRKYIRFFTGLVLIAMLLMPVIDLLRKEGIPGKEVLKKYEAEIEENIPELAEEIQKESVQKGTVQIEVEEIVIEH